MCFKNCTGYIFHWIGIKNRIFLVKYMSTSNRNKATENYFSKIFNKIIFPQKPEEKKVNQIFQKKIFFLSPYFC